MADFSLNINTPIEITVLSRSCQLNIDCYLFIYTLT